MCFFKSREWRPQENYSKWWGWYPRAPWGPLLRRDLAELPVGLLCWNSSTETVCWGHPGASRSVPPLQAEDRAHTFLLLYGGQCRDHEAEVYGLTGATLV